MTTKRLSMFVAFALLVVLGATSWAGDRAATLSITWQDKPLSDALATLQKHFGISYVLPAELGTLAVSATLWDATPESALATLVSRAGLQAEDRNGTWVISAGESAPGGDLAFAQFPGMDIGMPGGPGGFGGPGATGIPGMQLPGPTSGFGTPPGRGGTPTTGLMTQGMTTGTLTPEQRPMHFIVIPLFRASPETIGYAIQADDVIYDMTGGEYGSGDYGSYGSSSYGSSDYGSSRGSSSRGSSRSSDYGSSSSSRSSRSSRSSY